MKQSLVSKSSIILFHIVYTKFSRYIAFSSSFSFFKKWGLVNKVRNQNILGMLTTYCLQN